MLLRRNAGWLFVLLVLVSGCTSVAINAGFDDVRGTVEERSASKIFWNNGTDLDKEAAEKVGSLLKAKLTADDAVQIALLNNRDLQAVYSDLGVAQADLVQAGLLNNPIFDAAIMFPTVRRPAESGAHRGDELSRCLLHAAPETSGCRPV